MLGRLEPLAGPLARPGMARRAVPRGGLALDQRRQAPVRRVVRRRRARGRPGAAPLRSAPSPGRGRASRRGAARAAWLPAASTRRCWRPPSACAPWSVVSPSWSVRWRRPSVVRTVPRTCWATRAPAPAARANVSGVPAARRERVRVAASTATEQVEVLAADADARVRAAYDQAQAAVADTHEARRAARAAEARAADAEARATRPSGCWLRRRRRRGAQASRRARRWPSSEAVSRRSARLRRRSARRWRRRVPPRIVRRRPSAVRASWRRWSAASRGS